MTFTLKTSDLFFERLLAWADTFHVFCCLNSNDFKMPYHTYDLVMAVGVEEFFTASVKEIGKQNIFLDLDDFYQKINKPVFGHFGYDLKNDIEELTSENIDNIGFPDVLQFVPRFIIKVKNDQIEIECIQANDDAEDVFKEICATKPLPQTQELQGKIQHRVSKEEYLQTITKLQQHIRRGDIYEINYCQEFFIEEVKLDPTVLYLQLNKLSPSPFSCLYKIYSKYLVSASPERYIKREGSKLLSQPIKGTSKRGVTPQEDSALKENLFLNEKDRAENVMIVDLVRNDLSRIAKPGTVTVEELFGIYSFEHVHQMISTVVAEVDENMGAAEIIKHSFPMGSMTGAPKISALKLIEQYEKTKRGIFSGSVGYIQPNGDLDLNVVIRSFTYNKTSHYLSYLAGGAITANADAEQEYEECLLKAKAMFQLFS